MYLNLIQIAESFGVSEHIITEWVRKEGMPHVHDRGRILFERNPVIEWAAGRGLAAHAGFLATPEPALAGSLELSKLLRTGGIWRQVAPHNLPDTFEAILQRLPGIPGPVRDMLAKRLRQPSGVTLAPIGRGFALPHPAMRIALGETCALAALILLAAPCLDATPPDGMPITRMIFFLSPTPRLHVDILGLLARTIGAGGIGPALDALGRDADDEAILALFREAAPTSPQGPRP